VLADRIDVLGPEHPEVATTYGNLSVIEQEMGELDAAAEHGRRAVATFGASVGAEHPDHARLLLNLANTEYMRGDVESALALHEQANASLERMLGPRDLVVGQSLSNLGALYTEVGRYEEARVALRRSREILDEILPPGHVQRMPAIVNLARLEVAQGRLEDALAGYDEIVAQLEQARGREDPELVDPLQRRAEVYVKAKRADAAVADLRRAVAVLQRAEPAGARLAGLRLELADALWTAGEHEQARREAGQARALVEADAVDEALRGRIDAWLAAHRS
jgi:tetratricopeptide (TPR) repeat protein